MKAKMKFLVTATVQRVVDADDARDAGEKMKQACDDIFLGNDPDLLNNVLVEAIEEVVE